MKKTEQAELMGRESIARLIFRFALPSILGMLSHSLYNLVDRFFVGRYVGVNALAATSVCFPYMLFGFALAMLPSVGGGALISIALGKGDKAEAERVLGNGLLLTLVGSIFLFVIGYFFAEEIIAESGGGAPEIMGVARAYFDIIVWGVPFSTFAFSMNGYIRAQGRPQYAMGALMFGAVCNIALDALFIAGFGWGIEGAAFATILSQAVSFLWVLGFFAFKRGEIGVKLARLVPNFAILRSIIMLGVGSAFTEMSFATFVLLVNRMIAHYGGAAAMSALGIFMGWDSVLFLPVLGIGEAVQPIFGYNFGAKLYARIDEALKIAIIFACGYFLASIFMVYFFTEQMIALFTSDRDVIEIGVRGMRFSYSGVIFVGVTIITGSYLQGLGRARLAFFFAFCKNVLFLIPPILILPRFFGLSGVWGSFPVVDMCGGMMSIILLVYLHKNRQECAQSE